jgi:hypothetical protein
MSEKISRFVFVKGLEGNELIEAKASMLDAAIEITRSYASNFGQGNPSVLLVPQLLEETFNRLKKITEEEQVDRT